MKTTRLQLSLLALFLGCASLQAQYKWADPLKQDFHTVRGQAWQDELKDSYARLPQRAEDKVRKPLWDLSRQSAGLSVVFRSNASEIKVRYVVKGGLSMPHMPATGVSGIDLYATDNNGQERWCAGNYSMGDTIVYNFRGLSYAAKSGNGFEYQLFLPLYNSVSWMEIGVPADASFRFLPVSQEKPLVIYGTSIAQGACASRPGMAWGNILNRKLGHPVINLGFSGNGKLEEALFDLLSEIDARLYIIDCMPNLAGKEASAVVYQRTLEGVKKLREKSRAPILLVEHDGYSNEFSSESAEESYRVANAELRKAYETLQKEQVPTVYYLTKEEIGMPMDAMVDGVHSTDLGMQQYADSYRKKIGEILHEESKGPTSCIPCKQQRDPYDWYGRHEEILKLNKQSAPEVVMIGNSITHFWGGAPVDEPHRDILQKSPETWNLCTAGMRAVNLGFGYDRVENALWRLRHGELDGAKDNAVCVVLLGTNNLAENTDGEILEGIRAVCREITGKLAKAVIILQGFYPRNSAREGTAERIAGINLLLNRLAAEENFIYTEPGRIMANSDGYVPEELSSDGLHPSAAGYARIAAVLAPVIRQAAEREK